MMFFKTYMPQGSKLTECVYLAIFLVYIKSLETRENLHFNALFVALYTKHFYLAQSSFLLDRKNL